MLGRGVATVVAAAGAQAVVFIVAIALAVLAPIISRFIQLAVSRQREYLADAVAIELTRNPYGLERALAKISADKEVLEVANRGTQHMYFTNPIKKFEQRSSGLMSTHPAIIDRINRLRQLTAGRRPPDRATAASRTVRGTAWSEPRSRAGPLTEGAQFRALQAPGRVRLAGGPVLPTMALDGGREGRGILRPPPTGSQGWPSGRGSSVGRARD